jgi:hypothetical protein
MRLYKSTTAGVYFSARQSHDAGFRVNRNIQSTSRKYVIAKRRPELCRGVVLYFDWEVVAEAHTLKEAGDYIHGYLNPGKGGAA